MKKQLLTFVCALLALSATAQIKKTNTASVSFDATTPKDDWPKAVNNTTQAAVDTKNGKVEFKMNINNFTFKDNNAKIKEHWLDPSCMDGAKFPNADFKGKIQEKVNFTKDGTYQVNVKGKLTLHGKSKDIVVPATITVAGSKLTATSTFTIKSADFGVSHTAEGAGKVSKTPTISITAEMN